MTIAEIISIILRLLGFAEEAEKWYVKHLEQVKAQRLADTPKTDDEWTQKAKDGEL